MGGRDNITVVLFRVGGDETRMRRAAVDETVVGLRPREADTDTHEVARPPPRRHRLRHRAAPRRPRRARRRVTFRRVVARCWSWRVLAGAGRGRDGGAAQVYFVGQDDRGLVTLYRGVPYELPLGIDLYEPRYVSSVPARTLIADAAPPGAGPPAALARGRGRHRARPRGGNAVSARNRELLGLFPVGMLITAGFTGVYAARQADLGSASLVYGAIFLGAVPGGAPVHPRHASERRPVPVPAVRAAGGVRPGDRSTGSTRRSRASRQAGSSPGSRCSSRPCCGCATCGCWSATGT